MAEPPAGRIGAVVGVGLALAVALWLGYAFGRGQSLAQVATLTRDQLTLDYTIDTGQLVARYARQGGDYKPVFRTPDGAMLLDYSDWDYEASVIVDGRRNELVRLVPSDSVDYPRNRIVQGLAAERWQLLREVTLNGAEAEINFTFLAQAPVGRVQITVPHTNYYWLQVTPNASGFTGTVARGTKSDIESGLVKTPSYEVTLSASTPGPLPTDLVRVALATPFGVYSVLTKYELTNPTVGQYVQVARERLRWRKL